MPPVGRALVPLPPQELEAAVLTNDQLRFIANTEFVPKGLRGNMPAILACVATGRSIGIPDMQALREIHMIDGTPSMSAELMVERARSHGHSITGSVTSTGATLRGRRADNGDELEFTFSQEDAERAGLLGKANWKKHPASMYWARAASQLCRMLFPDCLAGVSYTPEEAQLSPEERVAQQVVAVQPPAPEPLDDDDEPGTIDADDADVVEEGSEEGTEGEPAEAAAPASGTAGEQEPGPGADRPAPAADEPQGSVFEEMARKAQEGKS